MTLRLVTDRDRERAALVRDFIRQFSETDHGARTVRTALRSTARRLTRGTRDELTFEWELMVNIQNLDEWYFALTNNIDPTVENDTKMGTELAHATAERYFGTVVQLLSFLSRRDFIDAETWASTELKIQRRKRRQTERRRRLTPNEFSKMLAVASFQGNQAKSARDAAALITLAATGARRSEVTRLSVEDLNITEGSLFFPQTKGGGHRQTALPAGAIPFLETWLSHRGLSDGPLFCSVLKSGRVITDRSISDGTLYKHWKEFAAGAALDWEPNPHDARRFFVTQLIDAGTDIFTVARLVGHSSPTTTQLYDTRVSEDLRRHLVNLPLPTTEDLAVLAAEMQLPERGSAPPRSPTIREGEFLETGLPPESS